MVNSSNNEKITGKFKLKLDADFDKLMSMAEKTGVPLTFRGDRIIDFKINGIHEHDYNIVPDQIKIGPPAFYFDLKVNELEFKNVPFDKSEVNDNIIIFKSLFFSELDINLKIKFKLNKENVILNVNISPKSNKIKDILSYEIRKREFSDSVFQLMSSGNNNLKIEGKLPKSVFDDHELEFYKRADYINKKLNLDLVLDEDYVITNNDFKCVNMICSYIKTKKVKLDEISLSIKTYASILKEFIDNDQRQVSIRQDKYVVELFDNKINLGPCKVNIDKYEILNFDELNEFYKRNKNNPNLIEFSAILKEFGSDELYLDFTEN